MTIILTGGSGFIGSHVLMALCKFFPKDRIVNVDSGTYAARAPLYVSPPKNLVAEKLDIRDQLGVHKLFKKYNSGVNKTATIHMAAESHVCRSISGPRDFAETNVMGTFNLLEAHREFGCGTFLHVSTDEVFGEIEKGEFTEDSPMRPRSPYAASKASSDLFVRSYRETYGLCTITVNMSNNFGPNQHEEKLVPRTIAHILSGKPVVLHGDGTHVRDWLYVSDAVAGILAAFQNGKGGETYCLGGNMELSNSQMIHKINMAVFDLQPSSPPMKVQKSNERPTDDCRYALDISKAIGELGWLPNPDLFEHNLRRTVEWYVRGKLLGVGDAHGRGAHT